MSKREELKDGGKGRKFLDRFEHRYDSDRTTFRLSNIGHTSIDKIREITGSTNISVFKEMANWIQENKDEFEKISFSERNLDNARRKTYVIEKNVLKKLAELSKAKGVSRDLFVDSITIFMKDKLEQELTVKQKIYDKYEKELSQILNKILPQIEKIKEEIYEKKELGEDKQLLNWFDDFLSVTFDTLLINYPTPWPEKITKIHKF